MTVQLIVSRHDSPASLLSVARSFLEKSETANSLLFGILSDLENGADYGSERPYLACAASGDVVLGVAIRTPPYGVVLSAMQRPGAARAFARDVADVFSSVPGVLGAVEDSGSFAAEWNRLTGSAVRVSRHERIHRCERVLQTPVIHGAMREMRDSDLELVTEWMMSFSREAHPQQHGTNAGVHGLVQRRRTSADGGIFLWERAGEVVAMAAAGGRTPNGIRIGPVYTPPDQRARGYGTALVSGLTKVMLGKGMRYCCLFTDLSNPTSNSIYRKIGYVPVVDVDEYAFSAD